MPFTVIVGCQWGDEGKGKIVDLLASGFDWVARFQGGANAGHTIRLKGGPIVLHQIPTGILHSTCKCALGNGMVLDPVLLRQEVVELEEAGIEWRGRLFISHAAHIVTPIQKALEQARGIVSGIGTTGRGIGPTYEQKVARKGLRAIDLSDHERTIGILEQQWREAESICGGEEALRAIGSPKEVANEIFAAWEMFSEYVCDASDLLLSAHARGERILCEGAQGALLDIDAGTYPFVTSSTTLSAGAASGLGIPPTVIDEVIGVVKAYTTRVGAGPFPTEFDEEFASLFRARAGEFGATTGRPRRCGWFDAPMVQRACKVNGATGIVVTKLDVLSGLERVAMATGRDDLDTLPRSVRTSVYALERTRPRYEWFEGWSEEITRASSFDELPKPARRYLEAIEEHVGASVGLVSVGPEREQVVGR